MCLFSIELAEKAIFTTSRNNLSQKSFPKDLRQRLANASRITPVVEHSQGEIYRNCIEHLIVEQGYICPISQLAK